MEQERLDSGGHHPSLSVGLLSEVGMRLSSHGEYTGLTCQGSALRATGGGVEADCNCFLVHGGSGGLGTQNG